MQRRNDVVSDRTLFDAAVATLPGFKARAGYCILAVRPCGMCVAEVALCRSVSAWEIPMYAEWSKLTVGSNAAGGLVSKLAARLVSSLRAAAVCGVAALLAVPIFWQHVGAQRKPDRSPDDGLSNEPNAAGAACPIALDRRGRRGGAVWLAAGGGNYWQCRQDAAKLQCRYCKFQPNTVFQHFERHPVPLQGWPYFGGDYPGQKVKSKLPAHDWHLSNRWCCWTL